jgi:hypothetical protein
MEVEERGQMINEKAGEQGQQDSAYLINTVVNLPCILTSCQQKCPVISFFHCVWSRHVKYLMTIDI